MGIRISIRPNYTDLASFEADEAELVSLEGSETERYRKLCDLVYTDTDEMSTSASAFDRFRKDLAAQFGFDLFDFGYYSYADLPLAEGHTVRPWSDMKGSACEALIPLFDHSDCEGGFDSSDNLSAMAETIRSVVDGWESPYGFGSSKELGLELADLMEKATATDSILVIS